MFLASRTIPPKAVWLDPENAPAPVHGGARRLISCNLGLDSQKNWMRRIARISLSICLNFW